MGPDRAYDGAICPAGGEEEQQESRDQSAKQRCEALTGCGCLVVQRREARPKRQRCKHCGDTQCNQSRCPEPTPFHGCQPRGLLLVCGGVVTVPGTKPRG